MKIRQALHCCILCLAGLVLWSSPAWSKPAFKPDVSRVLPVLGAEYDLLLLKAGKGKALWDRSRTLAEGLPKLESFDPLNDQSGVIGWAAVLCMVEKAVSSVEGPVPEAWDLELVRLYHMYARAEEPFRLFHSMISIFIMQRGEAVRPMAALSKQFMDLAPYARKGLHWLASERLGKKPSTKLRSAILKALVDVQRREAAWKGMERSAVTLRDLDPKDAEAAAALAEALFEQGKTKPGDRALAQAKGAEEVSLERARLRRKLSAAKKPARRAAFMVELGEYGRVLKAYGAKKALAQADPVMDEAYMDALMSQDFDVKGAWRYGARARGKPARPGFLGRRIGAGLFLLMKGIFSASGGKKLDTGVLKQVKADLKRFRKTDARLADLTMLYLEFIQAIGGKNIYEMAEGMQASAQAFFKTYPDDIRAMRIMYLLGELQAGGEDAWSSVSRYRQARRGKIMEEGFYPLLAGAAIRKAIETGRPHELSIARTALEKARGVRNDTSLALWQAHLMATEAMLQKDPAQIAARLQGVVDAYAQVIQGFKPGSMDTADLCDASSSVATLMFQSGGLAEALGLLQQVLPVCGGDANTMAVTLILNLAAGQAEQGDLDVPAELEKMVAHLSSRQAQIQTWLWLGSLAEANKDEKAMNKAFSKAAQLIVEEEKRGKSTPLAPDRRSVLSLAGQFHMGAGHAVASPFGLVVNVEVSTRMQLFPPAAVDGKKLADYLKKAKNSK